MRQGSSVLVNRQDQIYIPFEPRILLLFLPKPLNDIFSYPLTCLRKENINAIYIEKGMAGSVESSKRSK